MDEFYIKKLDSQTHKTVTKSWGDLVPHQDPRLTLRKRNYNLITRWRHSLILSSELRPYNLNEKKNYEKGDE